MDVKASTAMMAEHTMSEDSDVEFYASNTQLSTTPGQEWQFVVGIGGYVDDAGNLFEGGTRDAKASQVEGRNAHPLKTLMSSEQAQDAKLTLAELVALRLYTGPMVGTLQPQILLLTAHDCTGSRCRARLSLLTDGTFQPLGPEPETRNPTPKRQRSTASSAGLLSRREMASPPPAFL
jgi:hypothetical protein